MSKVGGFLIWILLGLCVNDSVLLGRPYRPFQYGGLFIHCINPSLDRQQCPVSLPYANASYANQSHSFDDGSDVPRVNRHLCDAYGFCLVLLCFSIGGICIYWGCRLSERHGWFRACPMVCLGVAFLCIGGAIELQWPKCSNCEQYSQRTDNAMFFHGFFPIVRSSFFDVPLMVSIGYGDVGNKRLEGMSLGRNLAAFADTESSFKDSTDEDRLERICEIILISVAFCISIGCGYIIHLIYSEIRKC